MNNYRAPEKTVTIAGHDYTGLNISGKAYAPVNRRVEAAHHEGGYTMIRQEWPEIFGIKCCEVEIEYKGQRFIGTAEVRMDFSRPISDAQTSALGRALAFAGFDIQTAIASAEDMEAVMREKGTRVVESEPAALPAPQLRGEFLSRLKRAEEAGLVGNTRVEQFQFWTGRTWKDLNRSTSYEDLAALDKGLDDYAGPM